MGRRLSGNLTILILRKGGLAPTRISIPKWFVSLVHSCALTVLGCIGFFGWHLQGLYGLQGQHVLYLGLVDTGVVERWSLFERLAPSGFRDGLQHLADSERALRLGLGDRRAASALLTGAVSPKWTAEAAASGDLGDGTLHWPVAHGYFGRGYGSGEGGYHLAVDIQGALGSEVSAAAPGVVGYVGNALGGYGNVVMVVHPGGWVTLYGHNKRILVRAGQRVHQGEPLALLGSSGRSDGPHVHFELIYQGRNCDPLPFVTPSEVEHMSAAGPVRQVNWDPTQAKPASVRCKRRMMHPLHEGHHDDERTVGSVERSHASPPS
ncbi:MAG: M23 family metallopeptidase [Polyangiales bacterium]